MHGTEGLSHDWYAPRRLVRLAVGTGGAGEGRAHLVLERLQAGTRGAFDVQALAVSSTADPEEPESLIAALLAGEADFAACSAERVPVELPIGIRLEGAMRASDPYYRLLAKPECTGLDSLPDGAHIAVCDAAARAQILFKHPSFDVELARSEQALLSGMSRDLWDAAIVSASSCDDPHLQLRTIPATQIAAPSGRGVIALLMSDRSDPSEPWRRLLNEPDAEDCLLSERAFLARMASRGAGLPIARAIRFGGRLELTGLIADPDGAWLLSAHASGPPSFGRVLGLEAAESCRELLSLQRLPSPGMRSGRSSA